MNIKSIIRAGKRHVCRVGDTRGMKSPPGGVETAFQVTSGAKSGSQLRDEQPLRGKRIRVISNEMNFLPEREPLTSKVNDYNRTRVCVSTIARELSMVIKGERSLYEIIFGYARLSFRFRESPIFVESEFNYKRVQAARTL